MLKIRRPLGHLIFNMGITIPGKTVFLIETAHWYLISFKSYSDYGPSDLVQGYRGNCSDLDISQHLNNDFLFDSTNFSYLFSFCLTFDQTFKFVWYWAQIFILLSLCLRRFLKSDIHISSIKQYRRMKEHTKNRRSWSSVCFPIMCALKFWLCLVELLFVMWISYDTLGQIWVDGTVYHINGCCTQGTHDIYPSRRLKSIWSYR